VLGCTLGQRFLGECYLFGLGTAIDVDEAVVWFERAAAAGFAVAQYLLGKILSGLTSSSSVPIDHERAFELYAAAAGQGYGPAQSELAVAYDLGLGVAPSLKLSIFWDRKAAMQGVASAQSSLAGSYLRLRITKYGVTGTRVAIPIALFWARKAAAAGDPVAIPVLRYLEHLTANRCSFCSASGSTLSCRMLRCSRCKEGLYCSVEHQKKHWKVHKRFCEEVKAASEEYEQAQKDLMSIPSSVYIWPEEGGPVPFDSESPQGSTVSQTIEQLLQTM
jgi:MYND finger/Sel1 repeat